MSQAGEEHLRAFAQIALDLSNETILPDPERTGVGEVAREVMRALEAGPVEDERCAFYVRSLTRAIFALDDAVHEGRVNVAEPEPLPTPRDPGFKLL